jgi:hypothetical protein
MSSDPHLWEHRPIDSELLDYAAQDVEYLGSLRLALLDKMEALHIDPEHVVELAARYLQYAELNSDIGQPEKHDNITGLLRNVTGSGIFIATNLGYIGLIQDRHSKNQILRFHSIGDFIKFRVRKVRAKKRQLILGYLEGQHDPYEAATFEQEYCPSCRQSVCLCWHRPVSTLKASAKPFVTKAEATKLTVGAPEFRKADTKLSLTNQKPFVPTPQPKLN